MNRRTKFLLLALSVSVVFALWQWFRPYDWNADAAARFKVTHCIVKRDHSNWWLEVVLKPREGQVMDYSKPLRLLTANGKQHEPAQMEQVGQAGPEGQDPADTGPPDRLEQVAFSFWLEEADFAGPMKLELNGASLQIRDGNTLPGIAEGGFRVFNTSTGW